MEVEVYRFSGLGNEEKKVKGNKTKQDISRHEPSIAHKEEKI
jgi:hypothetical protein